MGEYCQCDNVIQGAVHDVFIKELGGHHNFSSHKNKVLWNGFQIVHLEGVFTDAN
jgi:hypothetical protein